MIEFDLKNSIYYKGNMTSRAQENKNKKILLFAKECKENELDLTKKMNQLLKYAKVVSVRDEQKKMRIKLKNEIKRKDEKLELMMELERLKGLKLEEEEKNKLKEKRLEGKKILLEQIKQNRIRKEKEKEELIKEGKEIQKKINEIEEENKIIEQKKFNEKIKAAKEIVENNKIIAQMKEKILKKEKENDLRILKYNMEKAKKEEEQFTQRKLFQLQKEQEIQKLREKQEQMSDNKILLDELRYKRNIEEVEKKQREKELNNAIKIIKQKKELIEGNELQKIKKRNIKRLMIKNYMKK